MHDLKEDGWAGCENLIREFEQAWRRGAAPSIDDYLAADGSKLRELLRELVHADLEFRLKAGEQVVVERYLERYPELAEDTEIVLDLIAAEYELRRRRDTHVHAEEYSQRFPTFRSRLPGRLLQAADTIYLKPTDPTVVGVSEPFDVPGYQILGEIGRGGMGVVYQAIETRLGRHVALKFVPAELAGDPLLMQRFVHEAKTASSLNHPHICTVHALGEYGGCPFMVLEYIEGQTLRSLAANRLSIPELSRLMRQAAGALAAAHAAGVVHRDIKPENVMVRPDGYVKVLDFGLSRRLPAITPTSNPANQDTWPGTLLGTVAYMSPEQAIGQSLGAASDIFSLGIVLYSMITGAHPFERGTACETLHAIVNAQPVPMSRVASTTPAALERLVEAMLQKDARLRPSAADVEQVLTTMARPGRIPRERARRRIVHREEELTKLREALAEAEAGRGSMVCIAGEPGIGKTTLVEDFLEEVASRGTYQVARGRCSERQAAATAYLPIIDALADLLRGETASTVTRLVRVVAPTWSKQLALTDSSHAPGSPLALSQQALLREITSLLTELSRLGTIVLFIDDVHWSDLSTVDLLAHLGRQCHALSMLTILTYRPTELLLGPHAFQRVKLDLQGQGICRDLPLSFLGTTQIENYLALTFPGHAFPPDFAALIHSRTEGSPLFMADLLRYLRERGVIAQIDGCWSLARELPEIWSDLPETVRSMIQRKLDQLHEDDRRLLSIAAAQGHHFDSAVVSTAAGHDPADVEERLQVLERVHGLVRFLREDEFPDGTPTLRCAFVHVLYHQAFYASLSPTRRRTISRALAEAWQQRLGGEITSFAAELGCLYEAGREPARAAEQFYLAAKQAARVFAHRDALVLARRGINLLESLPPSAQRDALELSLQTLLGLQLQMTEGYAARSVELAYERARELSGDQVPFPVLWGLWLVRKVRSELPRAQELAQQLFALARDLHEPDLALQAHQALGLTSLCRGAPAQALRHVEQVAAQYDLERHGPHAIVFGQDPGVICKAYGAVALWLLGFPDAAESQSNQAIAMSRGLSPTSQSVALHFAAMVFQLCRNEQRARECAEASSVISSEHGLAFWLAGGTIIGGWALASEGDTQAGVDRLRHGLDQWRATGSITYLTYYLVLLAEALSAQRDFEAAQQVLEDAIAVTLRTDERMVEPELYRLRGEMRLQTGGHADDVRMLADSDFRKALEIAQQQEAKSLSLRAACSLARLQALAATGGDARGILTEILNSFTEGRESPDLKDARSLLNFLDGSG